MHASIQKHTDFSSVSVAGKLSGQAIARDCSDRGSASRNRFADTPPHTLAHTGERGARGGRRRRLRNMPPTPKTPKTNYIRPDGRMDGRLSVSLQPWRPSKMRHREICEKFQIALALKGFT